MKLPTPLSREFKRELNKNINRYGGLLLCTDFDGTLVNFTGRPEETSLEAETKTLLTKLANQERVTLAVISGRSLDELVDLVPVEGLTLAGNHGLKIRFEDGASHEIDTGEKIHQTISNLKAYLEKNFGMEEGIIIEDKNFGLALHYRKYEGDEEKVKEKFEKLWAKYSIPELELIQGAKLLEVRPGNWNKGDAVKLLQEKHGKLPTIYIGDDTTDEDAFRVLSNQNLGMPILVNTKEKTDTEAQYRLRNPQEVNDFLEEIRGLFK